MRFETAITKQGVPLYVLPMPHVQSVATGVFVWAGTRDEKWPDEAGIAHALEHMVHQGNERCPDSKTISGEIESCGGGLNAFTCQEITFYHRVVPDHAFGTAVASLASQLATPLFRPADVEKEMKNVVQEIRMYHDNPSTFCGLRFESDVFGEHPLGKHTLGTEESVQGLRQADFERFWSAWYHPKNYVFFAVGNTTLAEAEAKFNEADFGTSRLPAATKNVRARESGVPQSVRRMYARKIQQAHVSLGVLVGASDDPDTKALDLFTTMLGAGLSFPLFQEVRDKRGLCYTVRAGLTPWTDCGEFSIYLGTDPQRVREAVECIHAVIRASAADEALFEKAREFSLGRNAITFVDPQAILRHAALGTLFEGMPKSPAEVQEEIKSQTFDGVRKAVDKYLLDEGRYTYVCVGPEGTAF